MKKIVENQKLCWYGVHANEEFWSSEWKSKVDKALRRARVPYSIKSLLAKLPRGARILEAGCGRGDKVKALLNQGFQAEGIDYAEKTVKMLQERKIPAKTMDVRQLNYEDNAFDAYLSFGVIEHFDDEEDSRKTLREATRVTKSGGRIFCSVPFTNKLRENYFKDKNSEQTTDLAFYQRSYRKEQLQALLKDLPLQIEKVGYENPVKGISDENLSFKWLRNPFIAISLNFIHDRTEILNDYGHMIYFQMINQKTQ